MARIVLEPHPERSRLTEYNFNEIRVFRFLLRLGGATAITKCIMGGRPDPLISVRTFGYATPATLVLKKVNSSRASAASVVGGVDSIGEDHAGHDDYAQAKIRTAASKIPMDIMDDLWVGDP